MPYYVGTDEAGYGPNLGPLVISASVWRVPEPTDPGQLYDLLAPAIVPSPRLASSVSVAMADSKVLYGSGKTLRHLERGLLGALWALGRPVEGWQDAWAALDGRSREARQSAPWYADYHCRLPLAVEPSEPDRLADAMKTAFDQTGVRLIDLRSRAVFPAEFNAACRRLGSKGLALSHWTLALLADTICGLADEPLHVLCDKHGGRDHYADLLAKHFPEWLVEIHGESRQRSTYRFRPPRRRVEIAFAAKAESYLPAALASMASKYVRELAMLAFNAFWTARVEGLQPTAGYPVDARRFKQQIAACQESLGIEDDVLWRER